MRLLLLKDLITLRNRNDKRRKLRLFLVKLRIHHLTTTTKKSVVAQNFKSYGTTFFEFYLNQSTATQMTVNFHLNFHLLKSIFILI